VAPSTAPKCIRARVVRRALAHNAAAIIVGHNHPQRQRGTQRRDPRRHRTTQQSLALVDVRLLDHFVIGDGAPVSLAARGWV
jgi:DNA repair protein RadC